MKMQSELTDLVVDYKTLRSILEYSVKGENRPHIIMKKANYIADSNPPMYNVNLSLHYEVSSGDVKDLSDLMRIIQDINKEDEKILSQFSTRVRRSLQKINIYTIKDLANLTESELLKLKNFGLASLNEVKNKLAEFGFSLKENNLSN